MGASWGIIFYLRWILVLDQRSVGSFLIKTIIENGQESPLLQASKSSVEDGEDELSRWEIKACGSSKISLVKVNM
ncbi:hypothetical protein YC2023_114441 [Brassica napus]